MLYDICWFDDAHKEQAMLSMDRLPEEERIARGKTHHFRTWLGVPRPNADGTINPADKPQCVCVDRRGSALLSPGGIRGEKLVVMDFVESFITVEPGFDAALIKSDTWFRPEFVKEAAYVAKHEAQLVTARDSQTAQFTATQKERVERASRRFYVAMANIDMGKDFDKLPEHQLHDILLIGKLIKEVGNEFNIQHWLYLTVKGYQQEQESEAYDPVAFLAHAGEMMARLDMASANGNA